MVMVAPVSPEPSTLLAQENSLGPSWSSVRLPTLLPVNAPMIPTTSGLAVHVSNWYVPVAGTTHSYHTDAPPRLSWMVGSFGSTVAPTLVPLTDPEAPLITRALAKLSLAGSGPLGATFGVT